MCKIQALKDHAYIVYTHLSLQGNGGEASAYLQESLGERQGTSSLSTKKTQMSLIPSLGVFGTIHIIVPFSLLHSLYMSVLYSSHMN